MYFYIVTIVIIIFSGLYYFIKKKRSYFTEHGIPTAKGQFLFGNVFGGYFRRKHFSELLFEMYNNYPDAKYLGIHEFLRPVIIVRDLELIKAMTIKDFDNFPDHFSFFDASLDPIFAGNLFSLTGDAWKENRTMLSPAFTSSKMKNMFELMAECAKTLTNYLSNRSADANRMVETKDLFTRYTSDVIASCAFGINVDSLKDPNNQFYVLGRKATNQEGMLLLLKALVITIAPKVAKLLGLKFVTNDIQKFFMNLIENTVQTREKMGINRPDMLQLMMDARDKGNKHLKLDTLGMTAQAFIFFFAGFDSTARQMCLIAHELAINPDVQKRLQDEIDEVWKETNGKPTYNAINGMLYLDAVFNESVRKHMQNTILDRVCKAPYEFPPTLPGGKPFIVPPGMNLWIPASAIHHDPRYYENPEKFDPSRYYEKKVTINDVTNLGFGIGPRSCIGNRFAILETKTLFFFLLSKFNLKANEKTCKPLKYSSKAFVLTPEGGYWITVEPRS